MSALDLIKFGAPLLSKLEGGGVEVVHCDDFDEVVRLEALIGKEKRQPMMEPERLDFVKGDAFWLFLMRNGEPFAGLAGKFVDLSNETLESYVRRTSRGQYGRNSDPVIEMDPMVGLLRGRMAYLGELKVREDEQGNILVLTKFARLMQVMAYATWEFDWLYGFVTEEHTKLNRLYGFSLCVKEAITWNDPEPDGRLSSHALLASSRRQIKLLLAQGSGSRTPSEGKSSHGLLDP